MSDMNQTPYGFSTNQSTQPVQPSYSTPNPQQPIYQGQYSGSQPYSQPPYPPQTSYPTQPASSGSFGWAVLGFFFPIVGLILWLVWKDDKPGDAHMAGMGALVCVILSFAVPLLFFSLVVLAALV